MLTKLKQALERRYKIRKANTLSHQKGHWAEALAKYDWAAQKLYGYDWGDPENANDRLGNYLAVKNRLMALVTPQTTIVEIGSLGGKWTQYLLNAKKIICVDINDLGFAYIRQKLPSPNIEFYLGRGDELNGIASESVDVVFSMDTLVRCPKPCIRRYFRESHRVLKQGGRIFFHLPCTAVKESRDRGFVSLSLQEIECFNKEAGFKEATIDTQTIKHGVIVEAFKH